MPAPLLPRDQVLAKIIDEFRHWGYDGTTLSRLSQATGLVKASLYHYFPKGKPDMGRAVLRALGDQIATLVLQPLAEEGSREEKLARMNAGLLEFYAEGSASCALEIFSLGTAKELFGEEVRQKMIGLRDALAFFVVESGVDLATALKRAEYGVSLVQGSLIMARGLDDHRVFQRAVEALPGLLFPESSLAS